MTEMGVSLAIECDQHPSQRAVGQCLFCGRNVCGDCSVDADGKTVCGNADHARFIRDYRPVCAAASVFEADMIRRNLELGGIAGQTATGTVFSRQHPLPVQSAIKVLVPLGDVDRARDLLRSLGLLDP